MIKDDPVFGRDASGRQTGGSERAAAARPPSDPADFVARAEIERLQAALAAAAARERTLADELQHRVRNILAMIRSITRQTWEEGASQEEYAEHLQGRLDAIARYQAHLGAGRAAGVDIEDIIRDELLQTHLLDSPRCTIGGPPVHLRSKQVELFGLAIHELTVNAIKFGALAQRGALAIEWSVDDAYLRFRWSESGVAVASSAPRPFGFGRRLIEQALPYQLGATTSFEIRPGGVVCSIRLPLWEADVAAPMHPRGPAEQPSPSRDQPEDFR